ncbi:MAG: hypothetical protein RJQ14_03400 [Marinoscillum sp.]
MAGFRDFIWAGVILCFFGCKGSSHLIVEDFSSKSRIDKGNLILSLKNVSERKMLLPNPRDVYVQRLVSDEWVDVPFVPCKCGAPCSPAIPYTVFEGQTTEVTWNMYSRTCNGQDATEELQESGTYRMKIDYQLIEYGTIVKSTFQWVQFDLP